MLESFRLEQELTGGARVAMLPGSDRENRRNSGELAERFKAAVLKTVVGATHRGFESLTLRQKKPKFILRFFFDETFATM